MENPEAGILHDTKNILDKNFFASPALFKLWIVIKVL
jgi:hypothetical protein